MGETIYSQEVNLISPDDQRLTWLLGGYGQWNTYHFLKPYQFEIGAPPGNLATEYLLQGKNPQRALAAFGEIGFQDHTQSEGRLRWPLHGQPHAQRRTDPPGWPFSGRPAARQVHQLLLQGIGRLDARPSQLPLCLHCDGFPAWRPEHAGRPRPPRPVQVGEDQRPTRLAGRRPSSAATSTPPSTAITTTIRNFQVSIGYPTFPTFSIELNAIASYHHLRFRRAKPRPPSAGSRSAEASAGCTVRSARSSLSDPRAPALGTATDPVLPCDPAGRSIQRAHCLNLGGRNQTYAPELHVQRECAQYDLQAGERRRDHPARQLRPRLGRNGRRCSRAPILATGWASAIY